LVPSALFGCFPEKHRQVMKNARLDKYLGKKHAVIDFHPDPS
jgi:hypothetical protein